MKKAKKQDDTPQDLREIVRDHYLGQKVFDAIKKVLPLATVGVHRENITGGTIYYAYVPPNEEYLIKALSERFGGFVSQEIIKSVVAHRVQKKNTHESTDRSDLVSRVSEKMMELLYEAETEFLSPIYEVTQSLISKLDDKELSTDDFFRLIDAIHWSMITPDWLKPEGLKDQRPYKVKQELIAGRLSKEILLKGGRENEELPDGAVEYYERITRLIIQAKSQCKNQENWQHALQSDGAFTELFRHEGLIGRLPRTEPRVLARDYVCARFNLESQSDSTLRKKLDKLRQPEPSKNRKVIIARKNSR